MKNFDEGARAEREARDRTFQIGGEIFAYKAAVAPETVMEWNRMATGEIDPTEAEALQIYDRTVLAFLEPGQDKAWGKVRDPKAAHPLSLSDLSDLIAWLFEENTGRPTSPPSDSSKQPDATAENSKGDSSSLVEAKA